MTTTAAQLVSAARATIEELDADQTARERSDGALLIDLREDDELERTGRIPGALHLPRGLLEFRADPTAPTHVRDLDPARRTILYCASGGRSALAGVTLRSLGYEDVAHLAGGIQSWVDSGRSTDLPS